MLSQSINDLRLLADSPEVNAEADFYREAKNSNLPVVILGAGTPGRDIQNFLKKLGIRQVTLTVTPDYFTASLAEEGVVSSAEIDKLYDKYYFIFVVGLLPNGVEPFLSQFKNAVKTFFPLHHYEIVKLVSRQFLAEHFDEFAQTLSLFEDDFSRESMTAHIKAQITRDTSSLTPTLVYPTYFQKSILPENSGKVLIDCGAFDGDTIRALDNFTGGAWDKVIAFEPDEINYFNLIENVRKMNCFDRVTLIKKGVSDKHKALIFKRDESDRMASAVSNDGDIAIEVVSIDQVLADEEARVTMLKMDIEGSEFAALRGAERTIKKNKPAMAICVYHQREDLITIPQYIKRIVPEYKLYLRNHTQIGTDMVLYAVI